MSNEKLGASFRDPAGFMFRRDGVLLRQINRAYQPEYEHCVASGLYRELTERGLLVSHDEVDDPGMTKEKIAVIRPHPIPYISYPYEWSFSQLQDAAMLTLEIQLIALEHGTSLKDASAFNVQFLDAKPVFIDTLSFEKYAPNQPWVAYRQFCQHFVAPLALMARRDVRLRQLLFRYIDGIPLDLSSTLLPASTYLKYSLLAHIHMHARSQRRHQNDARERGGIKVPKVSKTMFVALIASLMKAVSQLSLGLVETEWAGYYDDTNYSDPAMHHKEATVKALADRHFEANALIHDLGANTGRFSRILAGDTRTVVAHDIDDMAVEAHYRWNQANGVSTVLPLVLDLSNPSPPIGWELRERFSFGERVSGASVVALALVHHLALSNNVPLSRLADFFAGIANKLIIEFVPKEDSQVRRLLATRADVFPDYQVGAFEREFERHFAIKTKVPVEGSVRTIYYMELLPGAGWPRAS